MLLSPRCKMLLCTSSTFCLCLPVHAFLCLMRVRTEITCSLTICCMQAFTMYVCNSQERFIGTKAICFTYAHAVVHSFLACSLGCEIVCVICQPNSWCPVGAERKMTCRSPHIWQRPDEFDVDRWRTSGPPPSELSENFAYLPFGGGRRKCIGQILLPCTCKHAKQASCCLSLSQQRSDRCQGLVQMLEYTLLTKLSDTYSPGH